MLLPMSGRDDSTKSLRLLLVITKLGVGGAESQVRDLALAFKGRGHEVEVASLRKPSAHAEALANAGVPVRYLGMESPLRVPAAVARLIELYRNFKPDVVHAHCYHANIFCRLSRLVAPSVRLVCTAHSTYEISHKAGQPGRSGRDQVYRLTDRLSHLNTHVSEEGLKRYLEEGLFRAGNSRWVPNGVVFADVAAEEDRQKWRAEAGWPSGAFVWLHSGRLTRAKNQRLLLEAFSEVAAQRPEALLAIAGGGELEDELRRQASELPCSQWVQFLGVRDDLPKLMACADGFVLSSDWEGLPMVLLEAAAAALPCVCTDVGSVRLALGQSEFIVPPGDKEALAQAMLKLMAMPPEERREAGAALRSRAEERFSLDRVAEEWAALYSAVLSTPPKIST